MVSRVSWFIAIVMLVRAIRLLNVVTITPVISVVWILLGSELLDFLGLSDFWGCTDVWVIRVFNPRGHLSVNRVSSVNSISMVIMIILVLRVVRIVITISVRLMLLRLLGLLGFVWCQSDVSCAVITLCVTFSPQLDRESMVWLALYVGDSTLWFFDCDCIFSRFLRICYLSIFAASRIIRRPFGLEDCPEASEHTL